MEILDATILSTAAPSIGKTFGVASTQIGVCATAYLITLAVLIPVSGWLADRWGAKWTFLAAIVIFIVASGLCASAVSVAELVAFRVLQGVGGALMVPVGRLVVLRTTNKADMIKVIAYLTWPALLAPVVAPAAGGVLATYASWRWIFLINVPLGLLALLAAWWVMPSSQPARRAGLDRTGVLGSGIGLGCLVGSSALLGEASIHWPAVAITGVIAVISLALTTRHLLTTAAPLLDLRLFGIQTFRTSNAGGMLFKIGISAAPFLLPLLFQDRFGWSAARAGLLVLFVFVGNLAIKPATTPMLRRLGFRPVLIVATVGEAASIGACGFLTAGTPVIVIGALLIIGGVFRSIGMTAYNTIAFADVDSGQIAAANTLTSTVQQLAQGLGVAAAVLFVKAGTVLAGADHAYAVAFVATGALVLIAVAEAVLLPADAGLSLRSPAA